MKLAFTFMNATIDKIIKTLFHNAQFELWDCEIYIYLPQTYRSLQVA